MEHGSDLREDAGPKHDPTGRLLDQLLFRCLTKKDGGWEEEARRAAAEHPEVAAELLDTLKTLKDRGLLGSPKDAGDAATSQRSLAREILQRGPVDHGPRREPVTAGTASPGNGEVVGPYRILRELGRGGQATVYLAEDQRLHRRVALKVIPRYAAGSEEGLQRFHREAEVASRLDHPGLCSVYEAGVEGGVAYIAMRYVEGETLACRIKKSRELAGDEPSVIDLTPSTSEDHGTDNARNRPAPATTPDREQVMRVTHLIEMAARALHVAHEADVIHRDLKPANIMVTLKGEPVVLDFGLAREIEGDLPTLTRTGDLFGTPHYMSPEQITRHSVRLDRRTDIYSLGATLYECLTLRRPFEAPSREALYQAILAKDPPAPSGLNPVIPRDLEVILETALEKDRDRRYQTALDLAEDLRRFRESEPILARPAGPILRLRRWMRRSPALAAAVLTAFFGLLTGLIVTINLLAESEGKRARLLLEHAIAGQKAEQEEAKATIAALRERVEKTEKGLVDRTNTPMGAQGIFRRYCGGVCMILVGTSFYDAGKKVYARQKVSAGATDQEVAFGGAGEKYLEWSMGTGFLVSADGLVVSNRHVIDPWFENHEFGKGMIGERGIRAVRERFLAFFPDRKDPIELVRVTHSRDADLALARFVEPDPEIPVLPLAPADQSTVVGAEAILIGFPMGLTGLLSRLDPAILGELTRENTTSHPESLMRAIARNEGVRGIMTQGVVSGVGAKVVVYDAPTMSGASGSPVFSSDGHAFAINHAITGFAGANLGIPVSFVRALLDQTLHAVPGFEDPEIPKNEAVEKKGR